MKKSFLLSFVMGLCSSLAAAQMWDMYSISKTSYVTLGAPAVHLTDTTRRDMVYAVTISSPGGQGSMVQVFDTWSDPAGVTATNTIVNLDGRLTGTFIYAAQVSSGISYTITAGAAAPKVTITYFVGAR